MGRLSRSHLYVLGFTNDRLSTYALESRWRVPLSYTDTPHHVLITYRNEFDRQRYDQVFAKY